MHLTTNHRSQFSPNLRRQLETASIGLGLARLLFDARRDEEAAATLQALDTGLHSAPARELPATPRIRAWSK